MSKKDNTLLYIAGAIILVLLLKPKSKINIYCPDGQIFCATAQQCYPREGFEYACPGFAKPGC